MVVFFDSAASLEVLGNQPADQRPDDSGAPSAQDIRGIVDAEHHSTEPDEESQDEGNDDEIDFKWE